MDVTLGHVLTACGGVIVGVALAVLIVRSPRSLDFDWRLRIRRTGKDRDPDGD